MRNLRKLIACLALLALSGCASLEPRPELPVAAAVPAGERDGARRPDRRRRGRHPGESGFRLVREGPEAFAIRSRIALASPDAASTCRPTSGTPTRPAASWRGELLEAADRGVRVRLLVDDLDARAKNYGFAALHAHPNIEVRMFNPLESRSGTLSFVVEALGSAKRINRRMHNKTWIADNRIAIVGGRNLGDEYFGASEEVNFVDLDFAMVGPIVRDASASFDRYWNSPLAYPMDVLAPDAGLARGARSPARADRAAGSSRPGKSRFADELRDNDAVQRLIAGDWPMQWSSKYASSPTTRPRRWARARASRARRCWPCSRRRSSRRSSTVTIISPYFVPGEAGTESLRGHRPARAATCASSRTRWRPTTSRPCTAATRSGASRCSRAAWSCGN